MKNLLACILIDGLVLFGAFYGIDREIARRDYVAKTDLTSQINGCIFKSNCEYYNKLLKNLKQDEDFED